MTPTPTTARAAPFRLVTDGDELERACWGPIVQRQFPSYERYWIRFVVPLTTRDTNRPNPRLKTDAELNAMTPPRTFLDVYRAELHYSVLWHLAAAYRLRHRPDIASPDFDRFAHALVRICSALDVADELLQRCQEPYHGATNPWNKAPEGRKAWRGAHKDAYLAELQQYRNHLIHSGAVMSIVRVGTMRAGETLVPRVTRRQGYRDWRSLQGISATNRKRDFRAWDVVIDEAWSRAVHYLERQWRWMLRQLGGPPLRLARLPDVPASTESLVLSTTFFSPEDLAKRAIVIPPI